MSPTLLPIADAGGVRRHVRVALGRRWHWLGGTAFVMVAESALGLIPPIAIGGITQDVVEHRATSAVIGPVTLLAVAVIAGAAAAWATGVLLARTVLPEVARLREDVLAAALNRPIEEVEAGGIGDLVARVSGDVERVSDAAEGALGAFLGAGLTILATLIGLASIDWRFALAGLLAVPIQAHTLRWYLRTSRPIYAAGRIAEANRASALLSVFAALPTVRAYRFGEGHRRQVEAESEKAMGYEFRATRAATRFYGRLNGAEFVGLAAILLVGYLLVRDGAVSIGAATTAALFFAALFDPINTVLGVFDSVQQATAALARLVGITMSSSPSPVTRGPDDGDDAGDRDDRADLLVRDADFGYGDGPNVVHSVSFSVRAGEHIAVVGATGSGKSTLAALLAGVRRPRRGTVTLGGRPLADIDPTDRHSAIAYITQETHVFAGTIADNLRLAVPAATDTDLTEALAAVGASSWVYALSDGADTLVGAGGRPLTSSQAQHLALARVLLLDPVIVILDEATAEAGSDSSRALESAATAVLAGRAGLVIAHRLTQARTADTILVMEQGVITEAGTHEDLVNGGGAYAALWHTWSGAAQNVP